MQHIALQYGLVAALYVVAENMHELLHVIFILVNKFYCLVIFSLPPLLPSSLVDFFFSLFSFMPFYIHDIINVNSHPKIQQSFFNQVEFLHYIRVSYSLNASSLYGLWSFVACTPQDLRGTYCTSFTTHSSFFERDGNTATAKAFQSGHSLH